MRFGEADAPECSADGPGFAYEDRAIQPEGATAGSQTRSQAEATKVRSLRGLKLLANNGVPAKVGDWVLIYISAPDRQGFMSNKTPVLLVSARVSRSGELRREHLDVQWPEEITKEFEYKFVDGLVHPVPLERVISGPFKMGSSTSSSSTRRPRAASSAASSSSSSSSSSSTLQQQEFRVHPPRHF